MSFVFDERREPLFARRFGQKLDERFGSAVRNAFGWYRRHRTLRALMRLDDRQLSDIGVARGDIAGIASRY
jgi:uncharacterized protein YjiS (DUF1127 family)